LIVCHGCGDAGGDSEVPQSVATQPELTVCGELREQGAQLRLAVGQYLVVELLSAALSATA
jgi:hypothetical protein